MLEPYKDDLSFRTLSTTDDLSIWNNQLVHLLDETTVCLTVELGKTVQSVGDVINLQQGDIVKLDSGPQDPVLIRVEEIPKFLGFPGIVKGNRAVEITSILNDRTRR
jgi:flagellar motor switch protein FliM